MRINKECFFDPDLPKNGFWGWNFENLTSDSESGPPRFHVCRFSGKMDSFHFLVQPYPKMNFEIGISKT